MRKTHARSENEMIAYALEIDEALLPFVPELLADFDELGSDAEFIVKVLREMNLPSSTRVLDLGCGKGEVSVRIATELGFEVVGIELFAPFVEECQRRAESEGVAHLCRFECSDILKARQLHDQFDVAIFAALGDVLGRLDATVGIIRQFVRANGLIVINDDYVAEGKSNAFEGFGCHTTHAETIQRLQSHGDRIERELLEEEEDSEEDIETEWIRQRAVRLAARQPLLKDALMAFVESQAQEVLFINQNLVPAVWVLRKSE